MRRLRRFSIGLCLALFILAVNLFGLTMWRMKVLVDNRAEAFLRYDKSPLLIEYETLHQKRIDMEQRRADGDPDITNGDIIEVSNRQNEMYPTMLAEHTERWTAAQNFERNVIAWSSALGALFVMLGFVLLATWLHLAPRPNSSPKRMSPRL